jgi:hypothetical protein
MLSVTGFHMRIQGDGPRVVLVGMGKDLIAGLAMHGRVTSHHPCALVVGLPN